MIIHRYLSDMQAVIKALPHDAIEDVVDVLLEAYRHDRRIIVMGNGGSATTASHFACDLGKGTILAPGKRFKVIALTDSIPLITAWANDRDYESIFVEQMLPLLERQDVVLGISGSGNSPNVLNALIAAREKGAVTIGLTGFQGGMLKDLVDHCIVVPSSSMQQIEDTHLMLLHLICLRIQEKWTAVEEYCVADRVQDVARA